MRCCGRSGADVLILITLFLVTGYSIHSFYIFIFPHTLNSLALAFLSPFKTSTERPTTSFPVQFVHLLNVSYKNWILFGVSFILLSLTIWAYVGATTVSPGGVPSAFRQSSPKSASLALKLSGALRMCPICATYKPQRTHHCSRCGRCVLKYDHHCPWLGQCVGFFNYKLYLLVIFYTFLLTMWAVTLLVLGIGEYVEQHFRIIGGRIAHTHVGTSGSIAGCRTSEPLLLGIGSHGTVSLPDGASFLPEVACPPFLGVYICFGESIIFLFLTGFLLRRHWSLARHNITTLDLVVFQNQAPQWESADLLPRNPFDLGVKKNLQQVFGDGDEHGEHLYPNFVSRWFRRLLPVAPYPNPLDLRRGPPFRDDVDGELSSASHTAVPLTNYGTIGSSSKREAMYHHNPPRSANPLERFLGLVFPTTAGSSDVV